MILTILGGIFGHEIGKDTHEGPVTSTLLFATGGLIVDLLIAGVVTLGVGIHIADSLRCTADTNTTL